MTDYRGQLLDWAKAQIGAADRVAYWRAALGYDPGKSKAWCGAFCLAGLHHVGLALGHKWGIDGSGMIGPLHLKPTPTPSRGDILYDDQPYQHHALFDYEHDGWYYSVDGNQGGANPVAQKRRRRVDFSHIYSIEPLIRALDTDRAPPPDHPTLRIGATGDDVVQLQQLLNRAGASLTTDGGFGPRTAAALAAFQRKAGLDADAVAGPKTWAALEHVP